MQFEKTAVEIAPAPRPVNLIYEIIAGWVDEGSSVLDLGCGSGELLEKLARDKKVRAKGIEISESAIYDCVARGLSVLHEDIERGLDDFAADSFDYVVLLNTFQEVKRPGAVLAEALRVGKKVIAGFPNFAYFKSRAQIFFTGRAPVTASLPYQWHETPNLHFLSIKDFEDYCRAREITVEKKAFAAGASRVALLPNLLAEEAVYLLGK